MKSMFLSLTALIVAALALINSVCGLQDSNLVISFLGVLVTLLVGWNIIQFIFAENTMHKIARDASDIVASETAKTIADDINHIFEGKLYIQTGKVKPVAKQILANPKVELCAFKDGVWLRVAGELALDDRVEAKKSMLDAYPQLRGMYDENDGNTAVFYFTHGEATFSSFTAPPETVTF